MTPVVTERIKQKIVVIPETKTAPYIEISRDGMIKIIGKSITTDAKSLYQPLFDGLDKIINNQIIITIRLDAVNAATARHFFVFFKTLKYHSVIRDISILWLYKNKDEEILELGKLFKESFPDMLFQFYSV